MSWPQEPVQYSTQIPHNTHQTPSQNAEEQRQHEYGYLTLPQDYLGLYQIPTPLSQAQNHFNPQQSSFQQPSFTQQYTPIYQPIPIPQPPQVFDTYPRAVGVNGFSKDQFPTPDEQYDFHQYSMNPTDSQPIFFAAPPQYMNDSPQFIPNLPEPSHSLPVHQQGTISPAQLNSALKHNVPRSNLMTSRGSTSSVSSTDTGLDWTTRTALDDLNPLQQALIPDLQPRILPAPPPVQPALLAPATGPSDTHTAVRAYLNAPNRLAIGERRITIMTPKVGQKSYGTEKRFMCPHPQVALHGESWWTPTQSGSSVSPIVPPRVNISFPGETVMKDAAISWTSVDGRNLDDKIKNSSVSSSDRPFLGNIAGKSLHISDADGKRKEVKAIVTVKGLAQQFGWSAAKGATWDPEINEVLGTFESKDIRVISKPSKKKSNTKSGELDVQHGSTVALFNRTKAQTTSTRYLSVPIDLTAVRGSDGRHVNGAIPPRLDGTSIFDGIIVSPSTWESFTIYLVDPTKQPGPGTPQGEWPVIPNNAVPLSANNPSIRYNSLVVLQSLQTGHCTPTLAIRRIEQDAEAVGSDGTANDHCGAVPEGELAGDMVSQLQKIAFEVYQPGLAAQIALDPGMANSHWLACNQDNVFAQYVKVGKRWAHLPSPSHRMGSGSKSPSGPNTPNSRYHILPMTPHTTSMGLPSAPSSPMSSGSSLDYFGSHSRKSSYTTLSSAALMSPMSGDFGLPPSTDGGPIRRQRTGSAGRTTKPMGIGRPIHRKRVSTDNSASSSWEHIQHAAGMAAEMGNRQFWSLDVGDVCVWTIVNTEQVSYTFCTPPPPETAPASSSQPITPFPTATKYLTSTALTDRGIQLESTVGVELQLMTLYGKGFSHAQEGKSKYQVWYGDQPAGYNEPRCEEVMAAAAPLPGTNLPAPILLISDDGRCIVPTGLQYCDPTVISR